MLPSRMAVKNASISSSEVELGQNRDIDSVQITHLNLLLKSLNKRYHQEDTQNIVTDGYGRTNVA